jgi:hypothetical protein
MLRGEFPEAEYRARQAGWSFLGMKEKAGS